MKNILKLFIGLILFVMFSCHNITNSEQETTATNNHAYISISLNGNARTVLPQSADFEKDFELSFELQGQQEGKDLQTIKKWTATTEKTAYTLMTEDTSVLINTGLWNFELSVQKAGQKVLFGTLEEITIQAGTNTLNFGTLQNLTSGNGSVSVALSFPQEGRVQAVQGGLYNLDGTALEGFEKESLTITTSEKSDVFYNKENVPCGTYLVKFELFSDKEATKTMNVYTEIVQVATGFVSAAQRTLEQLNTLYTITYDLSGGEFVEGFTAQASFNQAMTVTLPTAENLKKTGYVFVGWKNDQGDTVTEIPVGTIGDLKLTAQWEEGIRPKITNISLDRNHLDSIMTNRDITVSITGSDFNSLTDLLVQVTDGTTVQLPVAATIDKENNTAIATISAPIPSNPTDEGTTYAVKIFANDILEETTATFNVSLPADVTEITLAETSIKLGSSETVNVTVKGTNFDIRGITTIKLFDSNGSEITTSTITVPIEANTSTTEFVAKLPVPRAEDIYTVKIYINNAQDTTAEPTVQVYGDQTITSVTIANAGEGYTGELPVTIIGENLKGHAITSNDASFGNVTYLSDTKATATITCNGVVGENTITVTSGISSASGTVKVVAAENCFSVGDILFTDGTKIRAQCGVPDSQLSKAFAVIASAPYGGGIGKAVGLQRPSSYLRWAARGTTGYSTNFTGIQATHTGSSSSGYTFTGDIDGSDNWEYICSIDPEGTQTATNYPAFNFALTYGTRAGLTGTDYENGWYVPSVAELYNVYTHREVVQTSLSAAGGFTLGTNYYWSSSQYASDSDYAYQVYFTDGNVDFYHKSNNVAVLVLQAFNAEQFNNYEVTTIPNITSVTIANAGEGYTGELLVTIIGENLKGHAITSNDASFGNVTYLSDTKVTATFVYNGTNNTITVTSGASSASGTVKVVAAENCFSVGDILFTDGTIIKAENVQYGIPDSQLSKAFAVIASAPYGGVIGKAVGLQRSSLAWAPNGTTGYFTNFTGIQATHTGSTSSGYTFSGDMDGSDNWEYICSIDPEDTKDPAKNYPAFNFALTYGTTAGLTGTEYENGWYVPSVAELYDVYTHREVVQTSLSAGGGFALGTSDYWSSSLYAFSNTYAYIVIFGDGNVSGSNKHDGRRVLVLQAFNAEQFNNYEVTTIPNITSVTIANAGEGYTGELLVTIIGENLKGHAITSNDASFGNVTYLSDTKVTATFVYNGTNNTITVTSGASSASGTVKIVETEKCFTAGDILFTDGTIIKAENVQYGIPDSQLSKAFAVVASTAYGGGVGKAVGLQKSSSSLKWAPSGTTGYNTNFTKIQADFSGDSSSGYTFSGDIDGSDNWEYICSIDPEGTKDAATNYPAFNFALTYGTTAGLTGTEYENGWYVPSVAELYDVYTHREVVQTSLSTAGGFTLGTSTYWSRSQHASLENIAYQVYFGSGYVYNDYKYGNSDVLVLQAFNAEQFNNYEVTTIPNITSVTIANAGEGYTGELPVTIIGENLKGHAITCSDSSFSNVNYVSDNMIKATVNCNGVVGETAITVTSGTSSASGTVKVVAAENCFSVGDVLFTDGTKIKAENAQYGVLDSQLSKAFAVIASVSCGGGLGKAVGLQKSSSTLKWAPSGTTGYSTNFTGIQGTKTSGDMDGSDNWEYICSIDPEDTKDPATNYPAFNFALTYGTRAGLTGTEYENGWYVPSAAELYDVYTHREVVQTSLSAAGGFTLGTNYYWSSSQYASSYNHAYSVDFDDGSVGRGSGKSNIINVFVLQAFNAEQFNNYEVTTIPNITSVTIANAGEGYTGELIVTIIGENLKGHAITCSDSSFGNVNYVSDNMIKATVNCNGIAGENTITVTSGISSASGTVKVVAAENCYSVGDILFTDGTRIKAENVQYGVPDSQLSKAFAVIASVSCGGGLGKAVGLQRSSSTLKWSPSNTTGYSTNFAGIQAYFSGSSSSGYTFSGDLEGSDNWEYICSIDPEGTKDPAANYPAFNFALTYGTQAGLTGTEYENGWYVPSVAELYDVYKNRDTVQTSLNAVGGFTFGTSSYRSSSQVASYYNSAYRVGFDDGVVSSSYKIGNDDVLVLQAFNAEQFN